MSKRKIQDVITAAAVDADSRVKQLLKDNAKLRGQLERKDAKADVIASVIRDVYQLPSGLQQWQFPKRDKRQDETAVVHLTDVHYGKKTASYSVDVCADRMLQLAEAVRAIVALRRKAAGINRVVLLLGGDMVEGQEIFPGQAWETEVDLVHQVIKDGPELVANFVLFLCSEFSEVWIAAVSGNHGKTSKHGVQSFNSDSIFYEVVRGLVEKADPKTPIKWDLPLDREPGVAWYAKTGVEGHKVVVIHGDLKGPGNQLGYAWYSVGRRVAQWPAVIGEFEYLFIGHNHQQAVFESAGRTILATGSMESDNSYAGKNFAAMGKPHQRLCFFNKRYGLLANHILYLK